MEKLQKKDRKYTNLNYSYDLVELVVVETLVALLRNAFYSFCCFDNRESFDNRNCMTKTI